jgi:ribosomal protein L24E
MPETESFEVEMKNGPNQQKSEWVVHFNCISGTEDGNAAIGNVSETWDIPLCDYLTPHRSLPLRFGPRFDEGEYLTIFCQNGRKVVFFTYVCHDKDGRDYNGKMVPDNLSWTREDDQYTSNGYKRVSWQVQH